MTVKNPYCWIELGSQKPTSIVLGVFTRPKKTESPSPYLLQLESVGDGFSDLMIEILTNDGKPLHGLKLMNLTLAGTKPELRIVY